jgi:hypothetical protein
MTENDALHILELIGVSLVLGLSFIFFNKPEIWTVTMMDICVTLGFLGTLYGIWIGAKEFGAAEISNVEDLKVVVPAMLYGMGVAIWTSIAGGFALIWLLVTLRFSGEEDDKTSQI